MQKEWNEIEISFLKQNHEKMSIREIANYLGRTHSSVENKSGKLGLKGERKNQFNIGFFKSPLNEFSAYWLGFIAADGYVSKDGKALAIELKADDFEHLKKFNKCLNGNIPVTFFEKPPRYIVEKYTGASKECLIRIYSKEMVFDLSCFGILPKKSLTIEFPKLENDYIMWHFLRGYFDGDGSVYYDKNSNQLRTKITSGSPSFRKGFCEFLNKFDIKTYISEKGEGNDCGISGKESTRIFLSNMYDNSNIYLDRKYKKYQTYKYLFGFNK